MHAFAMQVVNRDLSVMVLQQFQQIRKQEGSLKAPGRKPKPPPKTAHQPAQVNLWRESFFTLSTDGLTQMCTSNFCSISLA